MEKLIWIVAYCLTLVAIYTLLYFGFYGSVVLSQYVFGLMGYSDLAELPTKPVVMVGFTALMFIEGIKTGLKAARKPEQVETQ